MSLLWHSRDRINVSYGGQQMWDIANCISYCAGQCNKDPGRTNLRKNGLVLAHGLRTHHLLRQGSHGESWLTSGWTRKQRLENPRLEAGFQPINLPPATHIYQPDPISSRFHNLPLQHHKLGAKQSHESTEGSSHLSHNTSQGQHKTQKVGTPWMERARQAFRLIFIVK